MSKRFLFFTLIVLALATITACAAPTPAPTAAPPFAQVAPASSSSSASRAPAATSAASSSAASSSAPDARALALTTTQRKIIKNAELQLTVENTDVALDRLTGITTDMGGYVVSTRVFTEAGLKAATISFAVPVDQFEPTLRRVRAIALKVEQESSSGQDVTDQYVDLESQLKNLEATANRIRDFLNKAQTVDEALKVNQQLSDVEKQIETIKGKMNYIDDRSAFSTLTIELREPRPTPTPTPTLTPTPTPTPVGWHPDETFNKAVGAQTTLLKALVDLSIWLIVVLLPYLLIFVAIVWLILRVLRGTKKPSAAPPTSSPEPPDSK